MGCNMWLQAHEHNPSPIKKLRLIFYCDYMEMLILGYKHNW